MLENAARELHADILSTSSGSERMSLSEHARAVARLKDEGVIIRERFAEKGSVSTEAEGQRDHPSSAEAWSHPRFYVRANWRR
jgi:phosphosulfolactate synthase (CoM biosynthesis protein A)